MFIVTSEVEDKSRNIYGMCYEDALKLGFQMFSKLNIKVKEVNKEPNKNQKLVD